MRLPVNMKHPLKPVLVLGRRSLRDRRRRVDGRQRCARNAPARLVRFRAEPRRLSRRALKRPHEERTAMAANPSDRHPTDPAYAGAKAGTVDTADYAFGPGGRLFQESDRMSAVLAENWWAVAIRGVVAILFGLMALFLTGATIGGLVLLFAAYMMV